MGHVYLSLKVGFFCEIGQTCTVVHMEMSHQKQLNVLRVYYVEIGERLYTFAAGMQTAVEHDLAALALEVDAAAADLAPSAQGCDL